MKSCRNSSESITFSITIRGLSKGSKGINTTPPYLRSFWVLICFVDVVQSSSFIQFFTSVKHLFDQGYFQQTQSYDANSARLVIVEWINIFFSFAFFIFNNKLSIRIFNDISYFIFPMTFTRLPRHFLEVYWLEESAFQVAFCKLI